MKDRTYQCIDMAIDKLLDDQSPGKKRRVMVTHLVTETGLSRATLNRYLKANPELKIKLVPTFASQNNLQEPFDASKQHAALKLEIRRLKSEIFENEKKFSSQNKLKAHQIYLQSKRIELLESENKKLQRKIDSNDKIVPFLNVNKLIK